MHSLGNGVRIWGVSQVKPQAEQNKSLQTLLSHSPLWESSQIIPLYQHLDVFIVEVSGVGQRLGYMPFPFRRVALICRVLAGGHALFPVRECKEEGCCLIRNLVVFHAFSYPHSEVEFTSPRWNQHYEHGKHILWKKGPWQFQVRERTHELMHKQFPSSSTLTQQESCTNSQQNISQQTLNCHLDAGVCWRTEFRVLTFIIITHL